MSVAVMAIKHAIEEKLKALQRDTKKVSFKKEIKAYLENKEAV